MRINWLIVPQPPRLALCLNSPAHALWPLLIVGCGDVGLRVLRHLPRTVRAMALTSQPARMALLRAAGAQPMWADLDSPRSLRRLAGLAHRVLYLAPPPAQGPHDERTRALLATLALAPPRGGVVYVSTTGVYGDHAGGWVRETTPLRAASARALRRVDAEQQWRAFGRTHGVPVTLLRVPGIYAPDRPGGDPRERVRRRNEPLIDAAEDGHSRHIHADDLARLCLRALWQPRPQAVINVGDDSPGRTGDFYDLVADACGLPRLPRAPRAEVLATASPMRRSFLQESRRIDCQRMAETWPLRLRYPSVAHAFGAGFTGPAAPVPAESQPTRPGR